MATGKRTTRRTGAKSENGGTPNGAAPPDNAAAPAPENGSIRHAGSEAAPPARPRSRRAKTASGAEGAAARPGRSEDRHATIARAAYFRSQSRGFLPGFELEDWLAAEAEVDARPM
jgi:hypothetical protein